MSNGQAKQGKWGMSFLGVQLLFQAIVLFSTQYLKGTPYLSYANYGLGGLALLAGLLILIGK